MFVITQQSPITAHDSLTPDHSQQQKLLGPIPIPPNSVSGDLPSQHFFSDQTHPAVEVAYFLVCLSSLGLFSPPPPPPWASEPEELIWMLAPQFQGPGSTLNIFPLLLLPNEQN